MVKSRRPKPPDTTAPSGSEGTHGPNKINSRF
jgi:hypothetical protein